MAKLLPDFFNHRIDVGILRIWVPSANHSNEMDWCSYVINSAFGKFGFAHASVNGGRPSFGVSFKGGNYMLGKWTDDVRGCAGSLVNCYDQASIVQIAAVDPTGSTWTHLDTSLQQSLSDWNLPITRSTSETVPQQ